jgi:hypothetical protein
MGKRRTRKDKEKARHQFLYSWATEPKKATSEANVNRQLKKPLEAKIQVTGSAKMAKNLAQVYDLASVRADITKSLIIASLILGAELVIYLAWF